MNSEVIEKDEGWYNLKHYSTREGVENSKDKTQVILEIRDIPGIKSTRTLAREYYSSKYSVFQGTSQFQIKLAIASGRSSDIEIYWRTNMSNFIKCTLLSTERLEYTLQIKEKHETTDFDWFPANQWQKCVYFLEYTTACWRLSLDFTFWTLHPTRLNSGSTSTQQEVNSDFERLLFGNAHSNSDVIIKSVEGEEFKAHKNILAARCKVLKAHFEHYTKESATGIVETQWEAKVLRDVLTYLYTGSAPGINDEPEKILTTADFYQLEGLKSLCVQTIIERLSVENAIETLQWAILHSLDTLIDKTLQFIKDGHARLITETAAWANVSNEVIKMIYEFITADEKISYNILAEAHAEFKSQEYSS